ncbi:WD40-repeat-containing domain protein [Lentinula guzmanii]|uniref:WD40-repeat-containing domain protein n=1 Tax=Lentinula guzmanii TaxID=2804957 RepID=A0AA38J516_9AGAR|nr:WD40-repeat-containing domain protein [Lentinula guzmanii]
MSSSSSVHTIPIVTVQATFPTVANEVYSGVIPSETIWISCYDNSPPDARQLTSLGSIHAKVRVVLDDEDRERVVYQVREGDVHLSESARRDFGYVYTVSSPSLRIPLARLLFPVQEYADPERSNPQKPHRITAFSLSPDKSQFATGYLDGSVLLYPTVPIHNSQNKYPTSAMHSPSRSTYTSRRQALVSAASMSSGVSPALARAHRSSVTSLRFFPSSRVLLSSGADLTLQIFPADPISASAASSSGQSNKPVSSVRTFTAHTRSVTSSAIIDRGREIISSSMDGTIRVWDVSTGTEETLIHSAAGVGIGINRIFLDPNLVPTKDAEHPYKRRLYAALQDGSFEVLNLDDQQKPPKLVHKFRSERSVHGALNAIAVSQPTGAAGTVLIAVGSAKGVVSVYNASTYASAHFRRSDASIEDLGFVFLENTTDKLGLVIATADGLPWVASLRELPLSGVCDAQVSVYAELVGGDVDAVRHLSVHTADSGVEVWTASDDGIVRRYVL